MRDFGGLVRLADAKHVLSVFDSCFSGTIFTSRSAAAPAAISMKTTKPVRQFLTSGDAGQTVRDDGSFRKLFLRAIRGDDRSDVNRDGYITGDELGLYLSQEVTRLTDTAQTPRWGRLQDVRFNEGDFVFKARGDGNTSPPLTDTAPHPGERSNSPEVVFWQSIEDSSDPADFEAYLANFPNGLFAELAKIRLTRLDTPAPSRPTRQTAVVPMEATFVALKNVNLRAAPTTKSKRLGSAQKNAGIVVTGHVPGRPWYRMRLPDGMPAFIHADLIKEIDPAELIAWYRVKQSRDFHTYKRFIRRFPDGHFSPQARRIGRSLYRAQKRPNPPRRAEKRPPPSTRHARDRERQERKMLNDLVRLFGNVARQAGRP